MTLALGTVQFGTAYGAFGNEGAVPLDEVRACLDIAAEAGIDMLDTARAYGRSEEVLGELAAGKRFRIVTKTPPLDGAAERVAPALAESLRDLKTDRVYAVMLHRASDLLGPGGTTVWAELERALDQGLCGRIGVSVYTPDEAVEALDRFPIQVIQAPFNAFDRRMETSGALDRLAERKVEVHVRSAFLQGFALAEPDALPPHLARYRPILDRFRHHANEAGLTPLALALRAAQHPAVARVVVGVQSPDNLREIVAAHSGAGMTPKMADCASEDPKLINPALWAQAA